MATIFRQQSAVVNPNVTTIENDTFKARSDLAIARLNLSDDKSQPARPGYGSRGTQTILFTNHVQLLQANPQPLYRYSLSINGNQIPRGKKLARLVQLLIRDHFKAFSVVSDYSSIILCNKKIPFGKDEKGSERNQKLFTVAYSNEDNQTEQNSDGNQKTYKILVQFNTILDANELIKYLVATDLHRPDLPAKQDIIQALNIVLGHGIKDPTKSIMSKSNSHFPILGPLMEKTTLGSGVEMFRGYSLSIRPAAGRLLLNIQVKHQAAIEPKALPILYDSLRVRTNNDEATLRKAERIIKGAKIKLTHFRPNRNKTILGFATPRDGNGLARPPKVPSYGATADKVQFWLSGPAKGSQGEWITVAEYFRRSYNKAKSVLPVVNIGTRADPKYVIAEVCTMQVGVPFRSRLDPEQSKAMIRYAVRNPIQNATSITTNGLRLVQSESSSNLNDFGWNLSQNLAKVPGRILPCPQLQYAEKNPLTPSKGSWNMTRNSFADGQKLSNWGVLWIKLKVDGRQNPEDQIEGREELREHIKSDVEPELKRCGLKNSSLTGIHQVELSQEEGCQEHIDPWVESAAKAPQNLRLLLVILPRTSATIYNAVKKAGDIKFGIHTVCVLSEKFYDYNKKAYYANVALKFNLKLGGRNQQLRDSDLGFLAEGKTMVVGLDVTHPAPGEDKAPSVASIVSSIDKHCVQWPAYIHLQPSRQEMVEVLKTMIKNRLNHWHQVNNRFPEQILLYRDGVGEGQYDLVRTTELTEIRQACKELYPAVDTKRGLPRITIVIVGKRHNTRFYPSIEKDSNQGNPLNGTVVDRGITETTIWDFFLQAHTAIKGTAKPAHYVVVHDEIFRSRALAEKGKAGDPGVRAVDTLEGMTHNLCYLYSRATKAVSICPPAYYADIACERARRWLSRLYSEYTLNTDQGGAATSEEVQIHPKLKDTMFYI